MKNIGGKSLMLGKPQPRLPSQKVGTPVGLDIHDRRARRPTTRWIRPAHLRRRLILMHPKSWPSGSSRGRWAHVEGR